MDVGDLQAFLARISPGVTVLGEDASGNYFTVSAVERGDEGGTAEVTIVLGDPV